MSTYKEMLDTAVSKGTAVELTVDIVKFEDVGQFIVGRMMGFAEFTESEYDDRCMKYTFDTDHGNVSCVLGAKRDEILALDENIGAVFCITFQGKGTSKKGTDFNKYSILKVPESTGRK